MYHEASINQRKPTIQYNETTEQLIPSIEKTTFNKKQLDMEASISK